MSRWARLHGDRDRRRGDVHDGPPRAGRVLAYWCADSGLMSVCYCLEPVEWFMVTGAAHQVKDVLYQLNRPYNRQGANIVVDTTSGISHTALCL